MNRAIQKKLQKQGRQVKENKKLRMNKRLDRTDSKCSNKQKQRQSKRINRRGRNEKDTEEGNVENIANKLMEERKSNTTEEKMIETRKADEGTTEQNTRIRIIRKYKNKQTNWQDIN